MKEFITIRPILQRNFKEYPSGRKKMMPDGNMFLYKVMMTTKFCTSVNEHLICCLFKFCKISPNIQTTQRKAGKRNQRTENKDNK